MFAVATHPQSFCRFVVSCTLHAAILLIFRPFHKLIAAVFAMSCVNCLSSRARKTNNPAAPNPPCFFVAFFAFVFSTRLALFPFSGTIAGAKTRRIRCFCNVCDFQLLPRCTKHAAAHQTHPIVLLAIHSITLPRLSIGPQPAPHTAAISADRRPSDCTCIRYDTHPAE